MSCIILLLVSLFYLSGVTSLFISNFYMKPLTALRFLITLSLDHIRLILDITSYLILHQVNLVLFFIVNGILRCNIERLFDIDFFVDDCWKLKKLLFIH